jgi:hypothetical protein
MVKTRWILKSAPPELKEAIPQRGMVVTDAVEHYRWLIVQMESDINLWSVIGMDGRPEQSMQNVIFSCLVEWLNENELQEVE